MRKVSSFTITLVILAAVCKFCQNQITPASYSCNVGNQSADWFVVYKLPGTLNILILSASSTSGIGWENFPVDIDKIENQPISDTLKPFTNPCNSTVRTFGVNQTTIAYNDHPAQSIAASSSGSKGFLLSGATPTSDLVYMVHTVPRFLVYNAPYEWPAAQTPRGHMFICMSSTNERINTIASLIRYQDAFIYYFAVPEALLTANYDLKQLETNAGIRSPYYKDMIFTTTGNVSIRSIAKSGRSRTPLFTLLKRITKYDKVYIWSRDGEPKNCKCKKKKEQKLCPIGIGGVMLNPRNDDARWFILNSRGRRNWCYTTSANSNCDRSYGSSLLCIDSPVVSRIIDSILSSQLRSIDRDDEAESKESLEECDSNELNDSESEESAITPDELSKEVGSDNKTLAFRTLD